MTDTTACPTCGATLPAAAAFCTSCGASVAATAPSEPAGAVPPPPAVEPPAAPPAAPPPPPPPPGLDDTRVDTPGLTDDTQVQAPPVAPPTFTPPAAPADAAWAPASSGTPVPPGGSTSAPWNPPASPPPPTWNQPAPAPAPGYGPPTTDQQSWTAPSAAPLPGTWAAPASEPTMAKKRRPSVLGGLVALVGAVLALVGIFSGWVTIERPGTSETITAFSMTTGDEVFKSNDPYLLVVIAVLGIAVAVVLLAGFARALARVGAAIAGVAIVAITALNWLSIASFVEDNLSSEVEVTTAIGFYLAIAGGILLAVAALMPAKK